MKVEAFIKYIAYYVGKDWKEFKISFNDEILPPDKTLKECGVSHCKTVRIVYNE